MNGTARADPRVRVLVVDDEPAVLETTAAILEADYDVETAAGAREALEKLSSREFDVICTDLHMPNMNGVELIRAVKLSQPKVAAVLLTGFEEFLSRHRLDTDSFLLLMKPYPPQRLIEVVRQAERLVSVRRTLGTIIPPVRPQ